MTVRAKSASRFLLSPEGRELAKGGGVATRSRCDRTHRTNHRSTHNFRSLLLVKRWRLHRRLNRSNGGVDRPTAACDRTEESVARLSRAFARVSALLRLRTIERRRRSATKARRRLDGGASRQPSHHRDRTDEPIGNQGRTGRFARSSAATDRTDASVGSLLRQGRTGEARRLRDATTDRGGSTA
jgi:hypothetical protein